ncbi:hypothetical protein AB0O47_38840, partial [Streptomyces noursei]|uniref:phage tail protein n=1 Tax=Streptomyces noursei TaxID=1971 RepID=UPI00344DE879
NALTRGVGANVTLTPVLGRAFRSRVRALARGMQVNVRLKPVLGAFRREVRALTRGVEARVTLRPNIRAFRAEVRALTRALGTQTVRVRCVRIGGAPCGDTGGIGNAIGNALSGGGGRRGSPLTRFAISGLLGPFSSLIPVARAAGNAVGRLWDRMKQGTGQIGRLARGLDRVLVPLRALKAPIVNFAVQLSLVGIAAAAAYQPIGALVQAVNGLVGGFAGVPAALGILGAGFLTISLAAGGMGEAISAALTRSDADFQRATAGLSKTQQKFAQQLRGFFKPLQEMASGNLFGGLQKGIEALSGSGAGNAFRAGLDGASKAMGELANQTLRFFATSEGVRSIQQSFGGLQAIFDGLAAGMGKLLKGWSDAMNALLGNGGVEALRQSVQGMTESFGQWLSRAAETGKIAAAWKDFTQTMKELFSIATSLVGIMNNLSTAMRAASDDGRGPLGGIADALTKLDSATSGKGMNTLITAFEHLNEVGTAVWGTLQKIGSAYTTYLGSLFTGGQGGSNPVSAFIDELGKGFDLIKPAMAELGKAFAGIYEAAKLLVPPLAMIAKILVEDFAKFIQAAMPGFQEFVRTLADTLKPVLEQLGPMIGKLVEIGGKLVSDVFKALAPLLPPIGDALKAILDAIEPMLDPLGELVDQIGKALIDALKDAAPFLKELANGLSEAAKLVGPLSLKLLQLGVKFAPPALKILGGLVKIALKLSTQLAKLITWVLKTANSFKNWLLDIPGVRTALDLLVMSIDFIVNSLGRLIGAAGKAFDAISRVASITKGLTLGAFSSIFSAEGRVVYGPTPTIAGEAGPEVIIPLTRPKRAAELVEQSGLVEVLARAGGMPGGGSTSPRDVSVHIHTPATSSDVLIAKLQRAMAVALTPA